MTRTYPPLKFQPQYDRQARAWNVVNLYTDEIVGMFCGGNRGEQRARRCANDHNTAWLLKELALADQFPPNPVPHSLPNGTR